MSSQSAEVQAFGKRGVRRPGPPPRAEAKPIEAVAPEPESDAPSDVQRLLGGVPLLTFAVMTGLMLCFGLEQVFAFDIGPGAAPSPESLTALGAASFENAIASGQIWRLFLAPLLHASSSHFLGNCLAFALVGFLLEPIIGRGWFALIFAASALGGVAGSMIGNPPSLSTVGASGAITGLIAAAFVMSFHARTDAGDARKMRRRALFFGVPALLPLFLGARGHTDYHAHLGGAIVGAAIAAFLMATWDGTSFRPRWARPAARVSAATLAASILSCAFIPLHFGEQAALAQTLIPEAVAAEPDALLTRRSEELMSRYPEDPRAYLVRASALSESRRLSEAETMLRQAMAMPWPARPWAETQMHQRAQGILAVLLVYDHNRSEAVDLARDLCRDRSQPDLTLMLTKAKLCVE